MGWLGTGTVSKQEACFALGNLQIVKNIGQCDFIILSRVGWLRPTTAASEKADKNKRQYMKLVFHQAHLERQETSEIRGNTKTQNRRDNADNPEPSDAFRSYET